MFRLLIRFFPTTRLPLLLIIVVVTSIAFTVVRAKEVFQVFRGSAIKPKNYKWFTTVENSNGGFVCSGSLVGSRYVLTAEHCVRNRFPAALRVRVSYYCPEVDNCGARDFQIVSVNEIREPRRKEDDFALLELAEDVTLEDVVPAIPDVLGSFSESYLESVFTEFGRLLLVGAGREERFGGVTPTVRKFQVETMNRTTCEERLSKKELLSDSVICTRGIDGRPCRGDSGGALVVRARNESGSLHGRDIVVAVHSFGSKECTDLEKETPLGHFAVRRAADRILEIICSGSFPADWCPDGRLFNDGPPTSNPTEASSSQEPTKAPTAATQPSLPRGGILPGGILPQSASVPKDPIVIMGFDPNQSPQVVSWANGAFQLTVVSDIDISVSALVANSESAPNKVRKMLTKCAIVATPVKAKTTSVEFLGLVVTCWKKKKKKRRSVLWPVDMALFVVPVDGAEELTRNLRHST